MGFNEMRIMLSRFHLTCTTPYFFVYVNALYFSSTSNTFSPEAILVGDFFFLFSEQINNTAHRNLAPLYEALEKLNVDELVRDLLWNSQLHSAKRDLSPTLMVLSIKLLKISEMKFLSLQG